MPPKGRGLTPIGTKNHTTPAQGTPVKVKAPVVTTRTSQKTPFSPATNVTTHGTNATTHHSNFTPATNAPKTLKIARTKPETLGHAIQRMRSQGYNDNAIRGQIKTWHPQWSEAQILNSIDAAQTVRTTLPATNATGAIVRATGGQPSFQHSDLPTQDLQTIRKATLNAPLVQTLGDATNPIMAVIQAGQAVKNVIENPGVGTGLAAGVSAAGLLPIGRFGRLAEALKGAKPLAEMDSGEVAQQALSASQIAAEHTGTIQPYVATGNEGVETFTNDLIGRGYSYHRLPESSFAGVRENGLKALTPRSGDTKGVYFGQDPLQARGLSWKSNAGSIFVRARRSSLNDVQERTFGEHLTPHDVPAHNLEYLGADKQWHPLAAPPNHSANLRIALKGAPKAYAQQQAIRSAERGERFAAAHEQMTAQGVHPMTRHLNALAELKGELPIVNYGGFSELNGDALTHGLQQIQEHPTLLPGQKTTASKALLRAFNENRAPAPHEQKVLEAVFGKDAIKVPQVAQGGLKNKLLDVANIPRSIMSTGDLSATFRQLLVAGSRHPGIVGKNFGSQLKAFKSEGAYNKIMDDIVSRPNATNGLYDRAKLSLTDTENLGNREEQYASNIAEKLTGGTKSPIRMSGRAYTAIINKTRADVFDHLIRVAHAQGVDVNNDKFLKSLGEYINSATGRGGGGEAFERSALALNSLLFSPRLLKSRLNFLNPRWYMKQDPFVRKQALRSAFQLLGATSSVLGLAALAGAKVGTDPRNADFAKIRLGNTRIDIAGGFQQELRAAAQIASGQSISSTTGRQVTLGKGYGTPTRLDTLSNFLQGKASPVAGFVLDQLRGKTVAGGKVNATSELGSHFTPMLYQDAKDIYHEKHGGMNGIEAAMAGYGVGALGFGLQTYGPKKTALDKTAAKDIAAVNALATKGHRATALKNVQTYYAVRKAINNLGPMAKGQKSERKRVLATLEALHSSGYMPTSDYNKYSKYYKSGKGAKLDESTLRKDRRWFTQTLTTEIQNLHKAMKASPAKPGS